MEKFKLVALALALVFMLVTAASHSSHGSHGVEQAPNGSQPVADLPSLPQQAGSVADQVLDSITQVFNEGLEDLGRRLAQLLNPGNNASGFNTTGANGGNV